MSCQYKPKTPPTKPPKPYQRLQVLANILANAVKFTPSGEVVIHASCKPAMLEGAPGECTGKQLVRVSIRDTGIGISEESMKKLFQCFRQGSESMSRRYGGTGGGIAPAHTRSPAQLCAHGRAVQSVRTHVHVPAMLTDFAVWMPCAAGRALIL